MKILLKGRDDSVAIMTLAPGADKEDAIKKFRDAHPEGFYVDCIEFNGNLPESREFRDAWTLKGKKVEVDQHLAKNIHLGRVRHARDMELDKLDKEQLRHLSDVLKLKEIEEIKQQLRDLPSKLIDLEWPDGLSR